MAQNRGGLSSVDEIEEEIEEEQPTTEPGLGVMVGSGKSAALANPSTLEAMAELYNQRAAKQNSFMEALKDAAAWAGGGVGGPTETLRMRDEQRSKQAAELFSMQNQIAQHRQAMQMADMVLGTTQPTAAAPGAATDATSPAVGGRTGGLLDLVKDPGLKRQIGVQYLSDPKAAMSQLNKYLMDTGQTGELWKRINELGKTVGMPGGLSQDQFNQIKSGMLIGGDLLRSESISRVGPNGAVGTFKEPLYKASPVTGGTPAAAAIRNPAPPALPTTAGAAPAAAGAAPAAVGAAAQPAARPPAAAQPAARPPAAAQPVARPPAAAQPMPVTVSPGSQYAKDAGLLTGSEEDKALRAKYGEAKIAGVAEESKEVGKEASMSQSALNASGESAGARLASIKNINNILDNQKNAAGPLSKPGMLPAVLTVIERGISAGNFGQVGMPGIESAVRQLGGTQEDIDAAQELGQEFAKIQLANAKTYLKGQGAVSDAERELIRQMSGKTGDSPNAIRRLMQLQKLQAEYEQDIHNDWINWQNENKGDFTKFKLSPEYRAKVKQYSKNLDAFAERPRPGAAKPAAQPGAKKSLDSHPGRALLDKYPKR